MSIFHPGDRTLTDLAASLAGFKAGDRVLDLGCGDGDTLRYLRETYGVEPYGCDTDRAMVARALEKAATEKTMRRAIEGGMLVTEAFEKFGVL